VARHSRSQLRGRNSFHNGFSRFIYPYPYMEADGFHKSLDLSRGTRLHYDKLGLLKGRRQANGYRVYKDAKLQHLQLLREF
jgi:Predicted transcriptional regulators